MLYRAIFLSVFLLSFNSLKAEILAITGVYNGQNLYVQNAMSKNEGCIKEIIVNETKLNLNLSANFFEVNMSFLRMNDPVSVKIVYMNGCTPKILNSDAIKPGGGFKFNSTKHDATKIRWTTKKETPGGKFIIEQLNSNGWKKIAELPGKSNVIINIYEITFNPQPGTKYRILYKEKDGLAYYSKVME